MLIPWSPLARGFIAGNRNTEGSGDTSRAASDDFARSLYFREADFRVADRVAEVATERGLKPAQVALAWILHKSAITAPIIGATKMVYLDDAVAALDVTLSDAEMARLEEPYEPHPTLGFKTNT